MRAKTPAVVGADSTGFGNTTLKDKSCNDGAASAVRTGVPQFEAACDFRYRLR
jgi:hypothetical protein